jgi:RNA polymerase sigma factor (sigma-70 family)
MNSADFPKVVMEHKDRVYSFAAHLLGDREEGRDVAQEALVRLWQHRSEVEMDSSRAWLMRTAHRLCLDRIRQRASRRPADPACVDLIHDSAVNRPDRRASSRELAERIGDALNELTPRDRSLLLLREVHGMPYDEMAETLSVPLGTLKAALHRARERCRRALLASGVTP